MTAAAVVPGSSTPPARGKRPSLAPTFDECRRYFEDRLHRTLPARDSVDVLCPFHPDKTASLSINLRKGVWHCHACNIDGGLIAFERRLTPGKDNAECWTAIYATIGRDAPKANEPKHGTPVARYDYRDANGEVVYQAVRYEPKGFSQRRPDGKGGWVWNMDGVARVPFNLPTLITANVALIAEGEKDALNLEKAAAEFPNEDGTLSYAATCNVGGAGKWLDEHSLWFKGLRVFVFPHNDKAGREHAQQVCASVAPFSQTVQLVELPGLLDKGDVSDYLQAHKPAELFERMRAAPVWTPPAELPNAEAKGKSVVPIAPVGPPMTAEVAATFTSDLLETCRAWIRRYIVLSDEQATIIAAWILHTYAFDAAETTPYIHITAPEKESGKSRLIEASAAIAAAPVCSEGMTAAALVRTIAAKRPTIFLDEMDAQLGGDKERVQDIRGILNAGFRKGGVFYKCAANTFELQEFNVYCPKCFAGIGQLPDTVASRSIVIEMRRKLARETVEPFREKAVKAAAAPIKAELEAWATRRPVDLLQTIEPAPIASLSDRQNDIAEPLLAIAQLAGDGWLQHLTEALQVVFKAVCAEDTSIGVTLLWDIRSIFDERKTDAAPSAILADCLRKIEGHPWAEWNHGQGITANNLARQLKKYSIYPQTIRVGDDTPKGYRRGDFEDNWSRYCPTPPTQTATPPQPASLLAETAFSNRNTHPDVAVAKSASNPHEQRSVAAVAVAEREYGPESVFEAPSEGQPRDANGGGLFDVEV